ncbi:MAG: non-canonical purine NTP pyrophosphatase [Chloroflexota bacterium]|nr:non-canonical purine NTP pyrophosphatase [Chloroflexota bacterium]
MRQLLVATNNAGKLREFERLLGDLPAEVVGPAQIGLRLEVPEPYETYAENATAKADAFCRASGLLVLADDSGLEAAALDWGPGVRTGRFGGPDVADRVAALLEQIDDATDRRARMVCWLAIGVPTEADPGIELFSGVMQGSVTRARRGSGGFGYDPVFELPSGLTNAELPEAEKDRISHRGRAVAAASQRLRELLAD